MAELENLFRWRVVGLAIDLETDAADVPIVELALKHNADGRRRRLRFRCPDGLHRHFPLLNASVVLIDTADRGWEAARRIEVTDTEDEGPYFYAESVEDVEGSSTAASISTSSSSPSCSR